MIILVNFTLHTRLNAIERAADKQSIKISNQVDNGYI